MPSPESCNRGPVDEGENNQDLSVVNSLTRRDMLKIAGVFGGLALATKAPDAIKFFTDWYATLQDGPVQRLESPPKVDCLASHTQFILTEEEIEHMKVRNIGDSVLAGFDGEVDWHPDAQYQVFGMDTIYNNAASTNPNLPRAQWTYEDDAVKGTEIWQWAKELEWYEIDRQLKEVYQPAELSAEDAAIKSETWQIGTGGNNMFHYALKIKTRLDDLFTHKPPRPDDISFVANGLEGVYKEAKKEYKKFLELVYLLKENGYAPNVDKLVLMGMADPTVLDEVDIEDPNGKQLKIEMDDVKRKYTRNAIINMNNTLKEAIKEFMSEHPDHKFKMLWIDPSEFLRKEDMHDIHPWRTGYWKIARKILDHYFVKEKKTGKLVQLGPIALPDGSPQKPKPEKKKISRRNIIPHSKAA